MAKPNKQPSTVVAIPNPLKSKSPWRRFQDLTIDLAAPVAPGDWVAAFDGKRWCLGKVEDLWQSFSIQDVTTGDRVDINSSGRYGRVVGMHANMPRAKGKKPSS